MNVISRAAFVSALSIALSAQNPQYSPFGAVCSASRLVPLAPPVVGGVMHVDLTNLQLSLAFMVTGFSNSVSAFGALPLDLAPHGLPGCFALVSADAVEFVQGSGYHASSFLPFPSDASLVGIQFYQQALVPDPTAGNPALAVMSEAMRGVIGRPGWPLGGNPIANMVPIDAGSFQMGSTAVGPESWNLHTVVLTRPFWVGVHEVTQAEYFAVMNTNPAQFLGSSRPVERVTWNDANSYCAALTAAEALAGRLPQGYRYRLPTEAEWEYCCRAGTITNYNVGNSLSCGQARYSPCGNQTLNVGSFPANPWGVHDTHGNVWEWCLDSWDSTRSNSASPVYDPYITSGAGKVIRGGSWSVTVTICKSYYRGASIPGALSNHIGFRVVLGP